MNTCTHMYTHVYAYVHIYVCTYAHMCCKGLGLKVTCWVLEPHESTRPAPVNDHLSTAEVICDLNTFKVLTAPVNVLIAVEFVLEKIIDCKPELMQNWMNLAACHELCASFKTEKAIAHTCSPILKVLSPGGGLEQRPWSRATTQVHTEDFTHGWAATQEQLEKPKEIYQKSHRGS